MKVNSYKSTDILIKSNTNQIQFKRIVRPEKFFQTQGNFAKKSKIFFIDVKRNYNVFDYENHGIIKNNKIFTNKLIKPFFNSFELWLKNFHKVSKKYFRGGVLTCNYDVLRLKEKGVTDIINLIDSTKFNKNIETFAQKQGVNHHHLELMPPYGIPTEEQIKEFLNITKNSKGAVYVHCLHGKDRTGIMSFIYEMEILKQKPKIAIKHLVNYGMNTGKNLKMIEFLASRYPDASKDLLALI